MSFADRLKKRAPLAAAAVRPSTSALVSLCLPRMLVVGGQAQGLVNLELAPLVVGGLGSTRILDALDELLAELTERAVEEGELLPGELCEAAVLIRQHLASIDAASELAHAEHEATHQHGKEPLQ